ncbi:MAG: peptidoglycan D,D-transpeptidase FtsI family protein [Raoultibacter sp.]|jgi:cell division protein FtsI (penicillin-binding protein 3)
MADRRNRSSGGGRNSRGASKPNTELVFDSQDTSSRANWVIVVFVGLAIIFLFRLLYLHVFVADEYSAQAEEARTISLDISPKRGTIYDRNGVVLATSVDATTIYAHPHEVTDAKSAGTLLASVLGGESADYTEKLTNEDSPFVYIARKADVEKAQEVKDLEIEGIHFVEDTRRVYPNDQIGGQVIGFVNIDGEGITGLELYYDDILSGTPGKLVVERGADGTPIPGGTHRDVEAIDGQDIIISIDIGMQQFLEERLAEEVSSIGGKSGNSVVMDGGTGEIYACASLPLFNPSDTSVVEEGATDLKSITQAFEPGSIFKAVSMSAILEAGVLTPDDTIFAPAYLQADEYYVSDAHDRGDETMTLRQILAQSSNVGTALATSQLGFPQFYQKILEYNLNEATGVDYPGEASGYLLEQSDWSLIQAYNVSFGQGVSVTPLQMTRFYGALVNEGVECTPHFLIKKLNSDDELEYETEEVITNKESIPVLTSMLESVVIEGTATDIEIPGYAVAGKTGTAEIANPEGGYLSGLYNISFVGFLPNSSSQLVCFVGATEVPGDRKVTSAFQDIMSYAVERYKIVPNGG